jgi:hypothetical protein
MTDYGRGQLCGFTAAAFLGFTIFAISQPVPRVLFEIFDNDVVQIIDLCGTTSGLGMCLWLLAAQPGKKFDE